MKEKIPILHLWGNETDAGELVRHLSGTGFEFEARLVRTPSEYVSAIIKTTFRLIIADENTPWENSAEDDLSPLEIAREIAPGVPFLLITESAACDVDSSIGRGAYYISRQDLHQIAPVIRKILRLPDCS